MRETENGFIDGLREQCAGLSPEDLHSAELLREYVCKGLSAAEEAGAVMARVEITGNPKRVILQADANVCIQIGDKTVEATSSNHPLAAYEKEAFAVGEDGDFYIAAIEV